MEATQDTSTKRPPVPGISALLEVYSRRRINPHAVRAHTILQHAIEYLADDFVHENGAFTDRNPQLAAIRILMTANRKIYCECPEIPTLAERCRSFYEMHLRAAVRRRFGFVFTHRR